MRAYVFCVKRTTWCLGWIFACLATAVSSPSAQVSSASLQRMKGTLAFDVGEDLAAGTMWYAYYLREQKTGRLVPLQMRVGLTSLSLGQPWEVGARQWQYRGHSDALQPGMPITVAGRWSRGMLRLEQMDAEIMPHVQASMTPMAGLFDAFLQLTNPDLQRPMSILNANAPIKRYVAVIMTNLKDKKAASTDKAAIEKFLFGTVNDVYDKATHGLVQFMPDLNKDGKADIFGPVTLSDTSAVNCRDHYKRWQQEAYAKVKGQGVDLTKYNHIIYIVPDLASCRFVGIASVNGFGGQGSLTLRKAQYVVTSHELAHNLGLRHASLDPNNDGKHNHLNTIEEYGDRSSFVGGWIANLNAPHMIQIGAFQRFPDRIVFPKVGKKVFKIYPLLNDPSKTTGPQVLVFPNRALGRMYYLSFKTGQHYDKNAPASYKRGVSIHTHSLLRNSQTLYVTTLADGTNLKDSNGIEIKQIKKDHGNAFVEVEVTIPSVPSSCQSAPPVLKGPASIPVLGVGLRYRLRLTLENKNSAPCGPTIFYLNTTLPNGYRFQAGRPSLPLTLQPGETKNVTVEVITGNASGDVVIALKDTFPGIVKEVSQTYKFTIDADSPTVPTQLKGTKKSPTSVELTWTAATDKGSGMRDYRIYRKLDQAADFSVTRATSAKNLKYTDSRIPAGTRVVSYHVRARDKAGNESTPSNVVTIVLLEGVELPPEPTGKEPVTDARMEPDVREPTLEKGVGQEPLRDEPAIDAGARDTAERAPGDTTTRDKGRKDEPGLDILDSVEPKGADSGTATDLGAGQESGGPERRSTDAIAPPNGGCGCSLSRSGEDGFLWLCLLCSVICFYRRDRGAR